MPADPKTQTQTPTAAGDTETREVYLRDGRTLAVSDAGPDQLVEIRAASGAVEVRIRLTAEGPVLQVEAARLQLRATEAVEIESKRVAIRTTEGDVAVDATGEVRINGAMIYLN